MRTTKLGSGLCALALGIAGQGAMAGEAETALLQSLIGSYNGGGHVIIDGERTDVSCKIMVSKGNRGKLVFRASCPLVAGTGAMVYNDATGRFEVVFSSSTDLSGTAAGKRQGDAVAFNLSDRAVDDKDNVLEYKVKASLGPDAITVTFDAKLNDDPWTGSLDFKRTGS